MKTFLFLLLIVAGLGDITESVRHKRAPTSEMLKIICRRNPELNYCKVGLTTESTTTTTPTTTPTTATTSPPTDKVTVLRFQNPVFAPPPAASVAPAYDWGPVCRKYQNHFFHYCFNVNKHPTEHRATIDRYCPLYYKYCPEYIRQGAGNAPQGQWFPDVPTITRTPLKPCLWDCDEPHCTEECKCRHHWEATNGQCHSAHSATFPMMSNHCQTFHAICRKYGFTVNHAAHEAAQRVAAVNSGLPPENAENPHNRNHHAQFWRNPSSVHTDWLHGNVKTGQDWGVPAVGIGGSVGNVGVKFPSVGSLMGIPNPHGPLRRKRRAAMLFAK